VIGTSQFQSDSTVEIRHYGPVTTTHQDAFTVERRPIEGGSWVDVSDDYVSSCPVADPRTIDIDPAEGEAWVPGYEYRISPVSNMVFIPASVLLVGDVEVSYAEEYTFVYEED
jgi:hypothetical protein